MWDIQTGNQLRLVSHEGSTGRIVWNRDESKFLTIGDAIQVWDAQSGKELVRLESQEEALWHAEWNLDGSKFLTIDNDGLVKIWYTYINDLLSVA